MWNRVGFFCFLLIKKRTKLFKVLLFVFLVEELTLKTKKDNGNLSFFHQSKPEIEWSVYFFLPSIIRFSVFYLFFNVLFPILTRQQHFYLFVLFLYYIDNVCGPLTVGRVLILEISNKMTCDFQLCKKKMVKQLPSPSTTQLLCVKWVEYRTAMFIMGLKPIILKLIIKLNSCLLLLNMNEWDASHWRQRLLNGTTTDPNDLHHRQFIRHR